MKYFPLGKDNKSKILLMKNAYMSCVKNKLRPYMDKHQLDALPWVESLWICRFG